MTEESEIRAWQRHNRPWRRWIRRHTWWLTAERRMMHALIRQIERLETPDA